MAGCMFNPSLKIPLDIILDPINIIFYYFFFLEQPNFTTWTFMAAQVYLRDFHLI